MDKYFTIGEILKLVNKYDYSIIYKWNDEILESINGNAEYDSIVEGETKEFEGYRIKPDTNKKLQITEGPNVIYVDYEEADNIKENVNNEELKDTAEVQNYNAKAESKQGKSVNTGDNGTVLYIIMLAAILGLIGGKVQRSCS